MHPVPALREKTRLAAIDIGTNSVHMIIVELDGRGYRIIDKEKEMVQLGRGSLDGQPLTDAAIRRGIAALATMNEIARRYEVEEVIAVATSALREAPNRQQFLSEAQRAGVHVDVISGEEEADLIFRAVRAAVDFRGGSALSVDIGGGSVELIVGTKDEIYFETSEPLGSLRVSQKFFDRKRDEESLAECRRFVSRALRRPLASARLIGFDFCVGTSGTIMALAEAAAETRSAKEGSAGLRWLGRVSLGLLIPRLASMNPEKRAATFDLDPRRAETILGGAVVLHEILDVLDIDGLWACPAALREGLVERVLERRGAVDTAGSVRADAVVALLDRSSADRTHAQQVARLAVRIFDQTSSLHGLGEGERDLLQHASMLHEVGVQVAFQGHHRHSYYLIRHAGLRGFTDEEVAIMANLARYYRKSPPAPEDANLAELSAASRKVVESLVAILRIADGLDRGHKEIVRDVSVRTGSKRVEFEVRARGDAALEIESARKRARYFEKLYKVSVEIVSA